MATKKKELNVDYIGGQEPLSKAEEQTISNYIKKKKSLKKKPILRKMRSGSRKKVAS